MVAVDQQYDIRLPQSVAQVVPFLGEGGGVDDDGGDVLGGADAGREGDGREDGLDLVGREGVFDERRNERGFAYAFVAADDYADWSVVLSVGCL